MNPVVKQLILKRFRSIPSEQWIVDTQHSWSARTVGQEQLCRCFLVSGGCYGISTFRPCLTNAGNCRGAESHLRPELPA